MGQPLPQPTNDHRQVRNQPVPHQTPPDIDPAPTADETGHLPRDSSLNQVTVRFAPVLVTVLATSGDVAGPTTASPSVIEN